MEFLAVLGEEWFDEYWINHGSATMMKDGKTKEDHKVERLSWSSKAERIWGKR